MRKKTFSRFLQGAVSMVMVASMLTGCGGSAASTSSSNASAETATTAADNVEYKDTLVVGEYGDSDSLDPQKNVSHDKIERELYEGLLEIDPDTGEFKGCLAESWEHSDDYMTWTFHLRKGVKFASSGKEMTSADVVATFDRLLDKEHPGRYYQNVEFIDTVTAPDDYTVVMTLAHAFGAVEDTLTQACTFILNKGWIGHSIGLNVHEYPCLEAGEDTPLQAGMVMSMEPSLTTPTAGTMCLEQNFIVTETGYELLSKMPTELVRVY